MIWKEVKTFVNALSEDQLQSIVKAGIGDYLRAVTSFEVFEETQYYIPGSPDSVCEQADYDRMSEDEKLKYTQFIQKGYPFINVFE